MAVTSIQSVSPPRSWYGVACDSHVSLANGVGSDDVELETEPHC